ncbi:zeta toxin family protein, partial [Streptococcus suis]
RSAISEETQGNVVIIDNDTFKQQHPNFDELVKLYEKDVVKYVTPYSNRMTEAIISRLRDKGYNLVIEGTGRTTDVPIQTATMLQAKDYETKMYSRHVESLYKEIRSFRHDYTNILISLNEAIKEEDIVAIRSIYQEVIADSDRKFYDGKYDIARLSNIQNPAVKSFSTTILSPIREEYLYRGIFQERIRSKHYPIISVLITAILFAFVYSYEISLSFWSALFPGFLFSWIYYKTNHLKYPIVAHLLSNGIVTILNVISV